MSVNIARLSHIVQCAVTCVPAFQNPNRWAWALGRLAETSVVCGACLVKLGLIPTLTNLRAPRDFLWSTTAVCLGPSWTRHA
jgi:hypothetical protein